jgi:hypothetical protein
MRGVIYMAWGENAIRQAHYSMMSLWDFERDMPVMVLGDEKAGRFYRRIHKVQFVQIDTDPFDPDGRMGFKFMAGRIKPLMAKLSPWEQTLYVDADSQFARSPQPGFDLLDRWDMAIACHSKGVGGTDWTNVLERDETAELLGSPHVLYHNSGMIFWRKSERIEALFDAWHQEWLIYQHWDEQVALLRALMKSDVVYRNLPISWNHHDSKKAYILHHQFGKGTARTEKSRVVIENVKNKKKIVKVEISPNVFVKCFEGDQEKTIEQYKRTKRKRRKAWN